MLLYRCEYAVVGHFADIHKISCSNGETANKTEDRLAGELTAMATRTLILEPEKPDPGESGGGEQKIIQN